MESGNYKRMHNLFKYCAKPALLKIVDAHMKEDMLSFSALLDRHKHKAFHLYRLPQACCSNPLGCKSPEKLLLDRNQWRILYDTNKNPHCNKVTCVCNVITNHVSPSEVDCYILSTLLVTFNIGKTDVLLPIRGIQRECQIWHFMRPQKIKQEAFEKKWKNVSDYLLKLGVSKKAIDAVKRMPVVDVPEYELPETCAVRWRMRCLRCRPVAYVTVIVLIIGVPLTIGLVTYFLVN